MKRHGFHSGLVGLALLLSVCAMQAAARADGFSGEIELVLRDAVNRSAEKDGSNLTLYLVADGGQWHRVWGKGYTISEHPGVVEEAEVTDTAIRLRVLLHVLGDFWTKGEWPAFFDLTLERDPGGALTGTYSGRFAGYAFEDTVEGRLFPRRPVRESFEPPAVDEHPRVLFRKADLPRLREKLETPFGKRYLERAKAAGDLINLGVLYQLTGDAAYADRARAAMEAEFKSREDGHIPVYGFGSGGFGHDIFRAAVAYDLCGDAWPQAFRSWLVPQFEAFTERQQHVLMTSHANYHPCSNYYGPGRGVPGVVSMVLWGDKGPEPKPPHDPVVRAWPVRAPENYTLPEGVPVVDLEPGKVPAKWIWTGLLPRECSRDVLTALGGYTKARPAVGTVAEYAVKSGSWFEMVPLQFRALADDAASPEGIDLARLSDDGKPSTSVYFTHIRVDKELVLRPRVGRDGVRWWISTIPIEAEQFYRLYPGVHPVTVEVRTMETTGLAAPRLAVIDRDAPGGPMALYRVKKALWEDDHALWERTGINPQRRLWVERGWFQNWQHYRWGVGDGGFMAETGGYAQISSWYPSVYASMYPTFTGRPVTATPDVSHIMPRQIMQAVFPGPETGGKGRIGARAEAMRVNSTLTLNPQWMATHFPIIPDPYKPSALWVWNYLTGVEGEATKPNALGLGDKGSLWGLGGLTLAQTFVHYPLDMKPVPPAEGMPKDWMAGTFGLHVFRSGWDPAEAVIGQVFGKSSNIKGWNHPNAGQFQIRALGHPWTWTDDSPGSIRATCSVVLLPEDETNVGGCGRLIHREARPDGSGTVTFDMGDVYAKRSRGLYDGQLNRNPDALDPSGITGLRAFGFDYSGASGAPALVAIVDKIDGGGPRLWTWQKAEGAGVETGKKGFTLAYPDATMAATFVTPGDPEVVYSDDAMKEGGDAKHGFWGTLHRIKVKGNGNFFVVATFQRGEAPPVKVEGEGLTATVTVGNQTVRFDGTRILFEPAPGTP